MSVRLRLAFVATTLILFCLLLQRSVFSLEHFSLATPNPLIVSVVALALAAGPETGAIVGFTAGLLADLSPPAYHPVGQFALSFCLLGALTGLAHDQVDRSALVPVLVAALGALGVVVLNAGVAGVFGGVRSDVHTLGVAMLEQAGYCLAMAAFMVPGVAWLYRAVVLRQKKRRRL